MQRSSTFKALLGFLFLLGSYGHSTAQESSGPAGREGANPGLRSLVLSLSPDLTGYFDDPDLEPMQEGLYRLKGWIADSVPLAIRDEPLRAGDEPALVRRAIERLHSLLVAYRAGDSTAVISLYDAPSRATIETKLADHGYRERWLATIRRAEAFEPLLLWETDRGYACVMYLTSSSPTGAEPAKSPFAVLFNRDLELLVGALDTPMHANLMRFLKSTTRSHLELLANYTVVSESARLRQAERTKR